MRAPHQGLELRTCPACAARMWVDPQTPRARRCTDCWARGVTRSVDQVIEARVDELLAEAHAAASQKQPDVVVTCYGPPAWPGRCARDSDYRRVPVAPEACSRLSIRAIGWWIAVGGALLLAAKAWGG